MSDKQREADEIVERILRELKQQRQQTDTAPEPSSQSTQPAQPEPPGGAEPSPKPDCAVPPAPQNPAQPEVERLAPAVEEIFPEPSLPDPKRTIASPDDLIDDRFREFFTTSVALDKPQTARREPDEERAEGKKGFFARLFSRSRPDEDEDEDDYDDAAESDAYLEDDEDDAEAAPAEQVLPAAPARPDLPDDIFAPEPAVPAEGWRRSDEGAPSLAAVLPRPDAQPAPRPDTEPAPQPAVPTPEVAPAPQPAQMPAPGPGPAVPMAASLFDTVEPESVAASAPVRVKEAQTPVCPVQEVPGTPAEGAEPVLDAAVQADLEAAKTQPDGEENQPPVTIFNWEETKDEPGANGSKEPENPTRERPAVKTAQKVFEDEEDTSEDEDDSIQDYESPEDAPAVADDLKNLRAKLSLRLIVTVLLSVFLLYITLAKNVSALPMPAVLSPTGQPVVYLLCCLLLTGIGLAVNWPTVSGGILAVAEPANPDIAPAFAGVFSMVQCVVFLLKSSAFAAGSYTPFCGIAMTALAANTLGKLLTVRVVQDNFTLASTGFDHAAAFCVRDEKLTRKVTAGLGEEEPQLLVSRPTALVRDFLKQSFSDHPTDKTAWLFGIIAAGVAVLCGAAVLVLKKDLLSAVSCMAGAMCLATPLASTLLGAVPAGLMQSSAARVGAVIPGASAVEQLKKTNVVLINGRDLFPTGSVVLRGIKTFQKERIDLAILYAASILVEGCETMRDVFLNVVEGKRDMLYKVENLVCETGRGFVGWIEGNRIIVGGRAIMQAHDIDIPSMDYEKKYTGQDKKPVYLSVSGRLFGMFLVSYRPVEEMRETVDDLRAAGLSLLVRSTDFNIDRSLICASYGVSPDSVKVLSQDEQAALEPSLAYLPASEGVMTHIGSFSSFVGGLRAALAASSAERTAGLVEAASVILALALTVLLTFTAGLAKLSVLAVLLYQLAWLILTLAAPLLKKY